jgi:cell division transport system permease protein
VKARYFKTFFRSWRHHTAVQTTTLFVLAGTFLIFMSALVGWTQFRGLLSRWGDDVVVSVYLDDRITPDQRAHVAKSIEALAGFRAHSFVSKDEALGRFQSQMATYAKDLVGDPSLDNPLPASFEVKLVPSLTAPSALGQLRAMADQIARLAGVSEVSYGQEWVAQYGVLVDQFARGSGLVLLVLLGGSFLVIGNSIRVSISQRRREIEILELVGATSWFIKVPFVVEGALMGWLASSLALGGFFVFVAALLGGLAGRPELWGLTGTFDELNWSIPICVWLSGPAVGAIGSLACVAGLNNGWAALRRKGVAE